MVMVLFFAVVLGILRCRAGTAGQAASTPAPPAEFTVSAASSVVSQYVFRGERLGGPSVQPYVELGAANLTLGLWTNIPIRDKVAFTSDPEVDFYGAYDFKLTDRLSLTAGFTLYDYPNAPTDAGYYRATFEPNVALNYTVTGIKFTPKIYYDLVKRGPTYEVSAVSALPLARLGTELDFTGVVGTVDRRNVVNGASPRVKAYADYWLAGFAAPFQLTKESKITLGWAYTKGSNAYSKAGTLPQEPDPLAAGRGVVTITFAHSF
jgi:hypothetical protein